MEPYLPTMFPEYTDPAKEILKSSQQSFEGILTHQTLPTKGGSFQMASGGIVAPQSPLSMPTSSLAKMLPLSNLPVVHNPSLASTIPGSYPHSFTSNGTTNFLQPPFQNVVSGSYASLASQNSHFNNSQMTSTNGPQQQPQQVQSPNAAPYLQPNASLPYQLNSNTSPLNFQASSQPLPTSHLGFNNTNTIMGNTLTPLPTFQNPVPNGYQQDGQVHSLKSSLPPVLSHTVPNDPTNLSSSTSYQPPVSNPYNGAMQWNTNNLSRFPPSSSAASNSPVPPTASPYSTAYPTYTPNTLANPQVQSQQVAPWQQALLQNQYQQQGQDNVDPRTVDGVASSTLTVQARRQWSSDSNATPDQSLSDGSSIRNAMQNLALQDRGMGSDAGQDQGEIDLLTALSSTSGLVLVAPDGLENCVPHPHQQPYSSHNVLHSSPDVMRSTLNMVPNTSKLLNQCRLPFGLLFHPYRDLQQLQVIQTNTIVRCRNCRTYINPYVSFTDNRHWRCNVCSRLNEVPEDFLYDPTSKTWGDPFARPEMRTATVEYIAPAEYMVRPPQPAVYLFLLDVTPIALHLDYVDRFCGVLLECLDRMPGDARTQIGVISYDSNAVHLYLLNQSYKPVRLAVEAKAPQSNGITSKNEAHGETLSMPPEKQRSSESGSTASSTESSTAPQSGPAGSSEVASASSTGSLGSKTDALISSQNQASSYPAETNVSTSEPSKASISGQASSSGSLFRVLTISDLDDVFIPEPQSVLLNLNNCKDLIRAFLRSLPQYWARVLASYRSEIEANANAQQTQHARTKRSNSLTPEWSEGALPSALVLAHQLLVPSGGRITVLNASLPARGASASVLKARDPLTAPTTATGQKKDLKEDARLLQPQVEFYKRLGLDCSASQIGVDIFQLGHNHVDLATIAGASRFSAGSLYYYPAWEEPSVLRERDRFSADLRRYLTRKLGMEAVMRVRCTHGIGVTGFFGNMFVRSVDLLNLANVSPDQAFAAQLTLEETIDPNEYPNIIIQCALLYTSTRGDRRIRVHTLALPITTNASDVISGADQQAILCMLSKMASERVITPGGSANSLSDAREALATSLVDLLGVYRNARIARLTSRFGSGNAVGKGLYTNHQLRLLALYIFALLKNDAFRPSNNTSQNGQSALALDSRFWALEQCRTWPVNYLIAKIYPPLYSLANLDTTDMSTLEELDASSSMLSTSGSTGLTASGAFLASFKWPPLLHLSAAHLSSNCLFLLDHSDRLYLFIGSRLRTLTVECLFGSQILPSQEQLDQLGELPVLSNPISAYLRKFLKVLAARRPFGTTLRIIRDDSNARSIVHRLLLEDRRIAAGQPQRAHDSDSEEESNASSKSNVESLTYGEYLSRVERAVRNT